MLHDGDVMMINLTDSLQPKIAKYENTTTKTEKEMKSVVAVMPSGHLHKYTYYAARRAHIFFINLPKKNRENVRHLKKKSADYTLVHCTLLYINIQK